MKKLLVLVVVFSLLLFACQEDKVTSGKFWAQNFSTGAYFQIDAKMLAENNLCSVWVEKNSNVTESTAQDVADTYKNYIYDKMMDTFGYRINLIYEKGKVAELNTIELANWLATGKIYDKKLTILLMNIKDDYQKGVNESYVAGYFWSGNIISNDSLANFGYGRVSNECSMIYVDTNPGSPGSKESNVTLAHELQHLMNFVRSTIREKATDLWIDEGLSSAAEYVIYNEHSAQRLNWYNNNGDGKSIKGLIDKGNNFFVWDNHEENSYALLDDYATVYLFFQWLRLQSNIGIYKKISVSEDYDYNAVLNAFNDSVSGSKYSEWKNMLGDWLAANYKKDSTSRYGYGSDTELNNKDNKTHYTPGGSTTISLFSGEGVYSNVTESFSIPTSTGNINYAGLNASAPIYSGSLSNGALLTYNANTVINSNAESGRITGSAPPPSASITFAASGSRSIGVGTGPFSIGAGDMLRRKGKNGTFSDGVKFKLPDAYRGIIVNE